MYSRFMMLVSWFMLLDGMLTPGLCVRYYLATSRELQRLNAVSRSPIISWFSESLSGLSTIRAFNHQAIFTEINERRVDRNQMCYLPGTTVNRWLAVRLEFIGASIIFISSLLAVSALITTGVDAGLVGLVISYALSTTSSLVSMPAMLDWESADDPAELACALCERSGTEHRQRGTNVTLHRT
jgi:ABC-type multidrug transport system fused ATPase/permease subunit